MLEFLLNMSAQSVIVPTDPPVILYDPATNKDIVSDNITMTLNAGTTYDSTRLINGYGTLKFTADGSGGKMTFKTPVTLGDNWTIEYDVVTDEFRSAYTNEIYGYMTQANYYLYSVWGDGGWNNQAQLFTGIYINGNPTNNNGNTYRYGELKSAMVGVNRRVAIVSNNGQVSMYRNGVRQLLYRDTTTANNQPVSSFTNRAMYPLTYFLVGYINGTWLCPRGAFGRLAIYNYPRYTSPSYPVRPISV